LTLHPNIMIDIFTNFMHIFSFITFIQTIYVYIFCMYYIYYYFY